MQPVPIISSEMVRLQDNIAGQLAESSVRVYKNELRRINTWLESKGKTITTLTYDDVVEWRGTLERRYALNTAQRKFSILKRVLVVAIDSEIITHDPSAHVRGIKSQESEKHRALTEAETVLLVKSVDRSTLGGARDYALLLVLALNGLRRTELVDLTRADLTEREGYKVLIVREGKGRKPRPAKLRREVSLALEAYLALRTDTHPALFAALRPRAHKAGGAFGRLTDKAIEKIVQKYATKAKLGKLLPHDLRATFATLAYEKGATQAQIQDAMGHADPRTTDRYRKRRHRLQFNAVDVLNLDLE